MNRRLPIVVLVLGALVAALLVDRAVDEPATVESADAIDASVFPIASPGARSSTWYCAGGTADEEGFADHSVLLLNPTEQEATVTVTVHAGELAPPSLVVDPDDLDEDDSGEASSEESTTTAAGQPDRSEPQVQTVTVGAQSREQIVLSDVVTAPVASALVESSLGALVVEHEVRSIHGYDAKPCATAAAPEWHFAWGDTSVMVTGLVAVCGVLFSWTLESRANQFYAFYFALIGGVYGVFLSLDLILLFVFYHVLIRGRFAT